jgi:hypothetical protein
MMPQGKRRLIPSTSTPSVGFDLYVGADAKPWSVSAWRAIQVVVGSTFLLSASPHALFWNARESSI